MFEKRKFLVCFCAICLFCVPKTQAQSVAEANKLFAAKDYAAAGRMYYQLYQFDKSVEAYTLYTAALMKAKKPDLAAAEAVKPLIQQAERAARMLSRCEDIQIIDSVIADKADFLNAYLMGHESGSLTANGGEATAYVNSLRDKRFYAQAAEEGVYRIFSEIKLQDQWTERKKLDLGADSLENNNYPFVLPDGLTVYFAATGKNSIGGYDLFLTRYNLNNDTYLAPNQLGMPFNSLANDYMMAIDELHNIGYFATDRFQPADKVVVYTFIPNKEFAAVENDTAMLVQRAKITSIRDSWRPETDYPRYIADRQRAIFQEKTVTQKDFSFVINDSRVYNSLNDFQNGAARQAFLKAQELEKEQAKLASDLEQLRLGYAQASVSEKKQLHPDILSKEQKLEELAQKYGEAVKQVRNLELKK
ncbi:hypothetical protein AGMMS49965_18510 [Bacteroidia bacterium]|nr:hypothetical protein AGMMS49965_18510 [Bacteroidia bacterium]